MNRAQHLQELQALESFGNDEPPATGLVDRELQLGRLVGGVQIDENEAGFGAGELGNAHSLQLGAQMPIRSPG
jgi:hypothetical protein